MNDDDTLGGVPDAITDEDDEFTDPEDGEASLLGGTEEETEEV